MRTVFTALGTLAGCSAARWYLDRTSRGDAEFCRGHVRLRSLWNEGAAFGLPIPKPLLSCAAGASLGAFLGAALCRRRPSAAAGLLLGGGVSNQLERFLYGRVYDYVQFPKAPAPWRRFVFNLADFAILGGGAGLLLRWSRDRRRSPL